MTRIRNLLQFNGNCREAMTFYFRCFGGSLLFQTMEDSPLAEKMPERMKQTILQATLINGPFILIGSDLVGDAPLHRGNAIAMMIDCSTLTEAKRIYRLLSDKGIASGPLIKNHFGGHTGSITDKYGNPWIIHYSKK